MDTSFRFAIQILSYNRPNYLDKTLNSLMSVIDLKKDKIAIIEQSDKKELQDECIKICQQYKNLQVYPLFKNLGQRGATNYLYYLKFFDDCQYVMLSDHDNVFHENLNVYEDCFKKYSEAIIVTGLHSPEHDIENKKDEWLIKSTCRAGHMILRQEDFIKLMPIDINAGSCSWYAGLNN